MEAEPQVNVPMPADPLAHLDREALLELVRSSASLVGLVEHLAVLQLEPGDVVLVRASPWQMSNRAKEHTDRALRALVPGVRVLFADAEVDLAVMRPAGSLVGYVEKLADQVAELEARASDLERQVRELNPRLAPVEPRAMTNTVRAVAHLNSALEAMRSDDQADAEAREHLDAVRAELDPDGRLGGRP